MQCSRNENASLHGNVTQFFLLQSGLPFFHYDFPLEYILGHDSLVPRKQKHTHKNQCAGIHVNITYQPH